MKILATLTLITLLSFPALAEENVQTTNEDFGSYFTNKQPTAFTDPEGFNYPVDPEAIANIEPASGEESPIGILRMVKDGEGIFTLPNGEGSVTLSDEPQEKTTDSR